MENGIIRQWMNNPYYRNYKQKIDETEVVIMSYNILAQDLIDKHSYLYSRHNCQDLSYGIRSERLFHEIKRVRPDILCLQEVRVIKISLFHNGRDIIRYECDAEVD